jgi:hypothetical protein
VIHELVRRLIGLLIEDVVAETTRKLEALNPAPLTMCGWLPQQWPVSLRRSAMPTGRSKSS